MCRGHQGQLSPVDLRHLGSASWENRSSMNLRIARDCAESLSFFRLLCSLIIPVKVSFTIC